MAAKRRSDHEKLLHPSGYNALKALTKVELMQVGSVLIKGDMLGLRKLRDDPRAPALLSTIASVIIATHEKGDMHALDVLLNRLIGRVPSGDLIPGAGAGANVGGGSVVVTLPSNGREVRIVSGT